MTTGVASYLFVAMGLLWWLGVNLWLMHLSMTGLKRLMIDRITGKEPQLGKFRNIPRYERIGNAFMASGTAIVICGAGLLALLVACS